MIFKPQLFHFPLDAFVIAGCCLLIFIFGLRYSAYKTLVTSQERYTATRQSGFLVSATEHLSGSAANILNKPACLLQVTSSRRFLESPISLVRSKNMIALRVINGGLSANPGKITKITRRPLRLPLDIDGELLFRKIGAIWSKGTEDQKTRLYGAVERIAFNQGGLK
jgi:hypothetical protein